MASITQVTPRMAQRGETITIAGAGFGASQGGGTVTTGGKALTNITWADAAISGKLAADCPYGAQDIVITPAAGTVATVVKGIVCYDSISQFNANDVRLGRMGKVYIYNMTPSIPTGGHVGFLEDAVEIAEGYEKKDFRPNDRAGIVKTFLTGKEVTLRLTLSQPNTGNLAVALGGSYDAANKLLTITNDASLPEYAVAFTDSFGVEYVFPRCQVVEPSTLTLNQEETVKLPLNLRVLALDAADGPIYFMRFPA